MGSSGSLSRPFYSNTIIEIVNTTSSELFVWYMIGIYSYDREGNIKAKRVRRAGRGEEMISKISDCC